MNPPRSPKIRPARLSDVPELLAMMGAFNRSEGIRWRRQRILPGLRRLLREPDLGRVIVAEALVGGRLEGRLIGYAVATFGYDLEFAGRDGFLTEIFVRARYRGTGAGRRILDATTAAMRKAGAAAITLLVLPANRPARRLYEAAEFAPAARLAFIKRLTRSRAA